MKVHKSLWYLRTNPTHIHTIYKINNHIINVNPNSRIKIVNKNKSFYTKEEESCICIIIMCKQKYVYVLYSTIYLCSTYKSKF